MDADPSFLYGAVALQAGLIDSQRFGEFIEACASWDKDRDGPLPDFLVARGWIQPAARAHLNYLVERKLQQHAGDAKAGLASVTHEIEQSLVSLRNQRLAASVSSFPASVSVSESNERYTLDHLHAIGGIGRVWLARDAQLGRDVALKELRPEQAENAMLCARFFREAQITGQ